MWVFGIAEDEKPGKGTHPVLRRIPISGGEPTMRFAFSWVRTGVDGRYKGEAEATPIPLFTFHLCVFNDETDDAFRCFSGCRSL